MIVESHTKINLGLKVLNQRPDSYHNIETVFIEIDFGDKLTIKKIESGDIIYIVEKIRHDKKTKLDNAVRITQAISSALSLFLTFMVVMGVAN